jgi:hypothetical protein
MATAPGVLEASRRSSSRSNSAPKVIYSFCVNVTPHYDPADDLIGATDRSTCKTEKTYHCRQIDARSRLRGRSTSASCIMRNICTRATGEGKAEDMHAHMWADVRAWVRTSPKRAN